MNKLFKNLLLVVVVTILFSACAPVKDVTAPVESLPEYVIVDSDVSADVPVATPVEDAASEDFSQFIGLNYPPLPAGLSEGFSMMIQDSNDFGLTMVLKDVSRMLWLIKMVGRDANGAANWEVVDVLALPKMDAGVLLIPDGCFLNGAPDSEVFVEAKDDVILKAWRANKALEKFEVISTSNIHCESDRTTGLD